MEDRYLFKAKTCNGEWAAGFLHCKNDKWYISNKAGSPFAFEVQPDTICQCTGLKDKNGKLIWENDILEGHFDDESLEDTIRTKVVWEKSGFVAIEPGTIDRESLDEFTTENYEVIGNIFDNPELGK